jgi:hypothetical protein
MLKNSISDAEAIAKKINPFRADFLIFSRTLSSKGGSFLFLIRCQNSRRPMIKIPTARAMAT